jgi:hypothetical protein
MKSASESALENAIKSLSEKLEDNPDGWFDCPNGWLSKPNYERYY